jgi:adhesin isopeptide-forming family sspB-C2 type protein
MYDLNGGSIDSNIVHNPVPDPSPVKAVTKGSVDINGKAFLQGETGVWDITLDGKTINSGAYRTVQFGWVDKLPLDVTSVDTSAIQVTGPDGSNVTSAFNQYFDTDTGTVYGAAKLAPTLIPVTGESVSTATPAGDKVTWDPNNIPSDLEGFLDNPAGSFDPLKTAGIDPTLAPGVYHVLIPFTVTTDTGSFDNTATQVDDNGSQVTNTVSNTIQPVDPEKDVVVNVGGKSVNEQDIYQNELFDYKLTSTVLQANRVEPVVVKWGMTDTFDKTHDQYMGNWAAYADQEIDLPDGTVLAKAGDKIAESNFDQSQAGQAMPALTNGQDLVTATFDSDTYTIDVEATDTFLQIVSADPSELSWSFYPQMKRIAPGEKIANQYTEHLTVRTQDCAVDASSPTGYASDCSDSHDTKSNIVYTNTPDVKPSFTVKKYDTSGKDDTASGDRDTPDQALSVDDGGTAEVHVLVTNTGNTPLTGLTFKDTVINDKMGKVTGWKVTQDGKDTSLSQLADLVIPIGGKIDIHGTFTGVAGQQHEDEAAITAQPVLPIIPQGGGLADNEYIDPQNDTTPQASATRVGSAMPRQVNDWNAKTPQPLLATTGTSVMLITLGSFMFAGLGIMLVLRKRGVFAVAEGEHARRKGTHAS